MATSKQNSTFRRGDLTNFNACVGNNGWADIDTYFRGYDEAAKLLIRIALNERVTIDTIVYPLIYNARHAVELFLKIAINYIGDMRTELKVTSSKIIKTHDLSILWNLYKEKALLCDKRLGSFIYDADEIISDFSEIDLTGETFRYPFSQDENKHLIETSLINIEVFRTQYCLLSKRMEKEFGHLLSLIDEYSTGTFTKVLSRDDLSNISEMLPDRSNWDSEEFSKSKVEILKVYQLSGKKFSEALNIIQKHREFSTKIGIETPLMAISQEQLNFFLSIWKQDISDDAGASNFPSVELVMKGRDNTKKVIDGLSKEEACDLYTLYELGSLNYYSEAYEYLYKTYFREESKDDMLIYLMGCMPVARYIQTACQKLNKPIFSELAQRYA